MKLVAPGPPQTHGTHMLDNDRAAAVSRCAPTRNDVVVAGSALEALCGVGDSVTVTDGAMTH